MLRRIETPPKSSSAMPLVQERLALVPLAEADTLEGGAMGSYVETAPPVLMIVTRPVLVLTSMPARFETDVVQSVEPSATEIFPKPLVEA